MGGGGDGGGFGGGGQLGAGGRGWGGGPNGNPMDYIVYLRTHRLQQDSRTRVAQPACGGSKPLMHQGLPAFLCHIL
jgi:hypothetical protein